MVFATMSDPVAPTLLGPLFSSAAMRAIVSDRARVQRLLDFEAALARAEAALGVISAGAAREIADACTADLYDLAALGESAATASNFAIPLIDALAAEVATRNKEAANYVHWGASSQDAIDTALVLELRAAIDALLNDIDRAVRAFTALTGRFRRTMTVTRTLMQQALPQPFGLKLAGYAAALSRSRDRLRRLRKEALVLQFGGAGGTLAALGQHGLMVSERLAALLDLTVPDEPWHSHRDRLAEVASAFAILAGTCGKIARDVALLMQSEVREVFEPAPPGRRGFSTLPHTRNPVAATAALSAATMAPNYAATILAAQVQEHERAVGGWQAEWITFPALMLVTSGALAAVVGIAEGLEVDVERMRINLERSGGAVFAEAVCFALAEKIGRSEAYALTRELTQRAEREKCPFQEAVANDERVKRVLQAGEIARLFMPTSYQGAAQTFIDRLAASAGGRGQARPWEAKPSYATERRFRLPDAKPESPSETAPAEAAVSRSTDPLSEAGLSLEETADATAVSVESAPPTPGEPPAASAELAADAPAKPIRPPR